MEEVQKKNNISSLPSRIVTQSRIELEGVRRCLSILPWELRVQQVLTLCGLTPTLASLAEDLAPMAGSVAAELGHTSLKSLIIASESDDGLALDWNEFCSMHKATVYKKEFNIVEASYEEVLAQYDDVVTLLGHTPVDTAQFHLAQRKALFDRSEEIKATYEHRIAEVLDRNRSLIKDLSAAQELASRREDEKREAIQESASKIQAMTRDMALQLEQNESRLEAKIREEIQSVEEAHRVALAALQADLNKKLESAEARRAEADSRYKEVQKKIDEGIYVSHKQVDALKEKLQTTESESDSIRSQLFSVNEQLTLTHQKIFELQELSSGLEQSNISLREQIEAYEVRIIEMTEDRMNSSEFALLNERLVLRKNEIEKLTQQFEELKFEKSKLEEANKKLSSRLSSVQVKYKERINTLNVKIQQVRGRLEQTTDRLSRVDSEFKKKSAQVNNLIQQNNQLNKSIWAMVGLSIVLILGMMAAIA